MGDELLPDGSWTCGRCHKRFARKQVHAHGEDRADGKDYTEGEPLPHLLVKC